jgi:asparagine synthase (glutamine-hydrolysing)
MGGLAATISWDTPIDPGEISSMMAPIRHRAPDGIVEWRDSTVQLAEALFSHGPDRPRSVCVDGELAIVADLRLHNRSQLASALRAHTGRKPTDDRSLLLAGYRRWGVDLVDRLDGDFAFVIWDGARRCVLGARDPFGARPLFYQRMDDGVRFASEPKQILCLPGVSVTPDGVAIGEMLLNRFEDVRHTFFEEIRRVRPAHYLLADRTGAQEVRHWDPQPGDREPPRDEHDALDSYRATLMDAVHKRLRSQHPVVAELSGGFDSASVVVLAARLIAEDPSLPPFTTSSSVYPGWQCDETTWIRDVVDKTGVPWQGHDPRNKPLLDDPGRDLWQLDSPIMNPQRSAFDGAAETMADTGARTLLTGIGGDEVVHEEHYLADLAARRQFVTMAREARLGSEYSWLSTRQLVRGAIVHGLPRPVARGLRAWRRGAVKRRALPTPLAPDFHAWFTRLPTAAPKRDFGFPTQTQNQAVAYTNWPAICWFDEVFEAYGAHRGYEVAHPFLDRELVELVASIPLELRRPNGRWKYLARAGLKDDLPQSLIERRRKTMFSEHNQHAFELEQTTILGAIDPLPAVLAPYVDAARMHDLVAGYRSGDRSHGHQLLLWRTACLRWWLEGLNRYTD